MYSSALITQTFLSLLLFQLQGTTMAKGDSGLMRLRAQTRSLADSPLSETFLSSDDHLTPEEIYKPGLATAYPGQQEQDQQSWLQQVPVETILTDCTSTTDESEQSLLPSAKFQRRQTKVQNACTPEWKPQPGQQKLNLDGQGQESGQTRPDSARDGQGRVLQSGELSKWNTYPSATELFRFNMFGRVGDSDPICDGFVGQSVPICAPFSLSGLSSPAPVLAPCRFCKCVFFSSTFRFFPFQDLFPPGWETVVLNSLWVFAVLSSCKWLLT